MTYPPPKTTWQAPTDCQNCTDKDEIITVLKRQKEACYQYIEATNERIAELEAELQEDALALQSAIRSIEGRDAELAAEKTSSESWENEHMREFGVLVKLHELALSELSALKAENTALRKDAERGRFCIDHSEWIRHAADDRDKGYAFMAIRLPYEADLSCKAMRENTIDAAIAQGEKG